jgi:NAD(P)-dependent dehydrogenase (short-subunit alcohol dehydrogenase family)
MAASTPSGRIGTVNDVADAIALFVSDAARWITGQSVFVTGGQKI